jgi:tripartite-type tricarboxylate transporter receptor subunit TctC
MRPAKEGATMRTRFAAAICVDTLNRGIHRALQSPDVAEKLSRLGMDPATGTPAEFARILAADYAKWGPIVKRSGFTAD